jgi:hypothetical protein
MPNLIDRFRLWIQYKTYRYSELGNLGDISRLTFSEISAQIKRMDIEIISQDEHCFRAKFEDQFTRYILRFHTNGQFVSIEEDSWKQTDH